MMAAFEEHCRDCERILGERCENVNKWLDEKFRVFGPLHRFYHHHNKGVQEAEKLFGELGRKAALIHILKDCGHIPQTNEWEEKTVDSLGMRKDFNGYWDPKDFTDKAIKLVNGEINCL
jgi:hypothetical protein